MATKWNTLGEIKICLLNSGVFVFVFSNEELRMKVLEQGPWSFENKLIILRPWKPDVKLTKEGTKSIQIWIRLSGLNLHFLLAHMLRRIFNAVGVSLFTDRMTTTMERMAYARICVEISADQVFRKIVLVIRPNGNSVEIAIIYEWLPCRCSKCKLFGHRDVTYKSKVEEVHKNATEEDAWMANEEATKGNPAEPNNINKKIEEGDELLKRLELLQW